MEIELHASIPQIQSAISIGGDQSARLKLDIPASEYAELLKLSAYGSGKLLRVHIAIEDE